MSRQDGRPGFAEAVLPVGSASGVEPPGAETPNVARLYDYALGGKDNFAVDRALFERISAVWPEYREFAVSNRRFLVRAVHEMASAGIDQFLDLGAGIPTSPNVHQVARELIPDATVVYVDRDPVVAAHCRALMSRSSGVHVVQADLQRSPEVLAHPTVRAALDFRRPIGLLVVAVLHFVAHDEAKRLLAQYRQWLATGSRIAISVYVQRPDRDTPALRREGDKIAAQLRIPIIRRWPDDVAELFTGFTVLEPGIVDVSYWRRGATSRSMSCLSGTGRLDRSDRPPRAVRSGSGSA